MQLLLSHGLYVAEVDPGLLVVTPHLDTRLYVAAVIERAGLDCHDLGSSDEHRHDRRSTIAAEATKDMYIVTGPAAIFIGGDVTRNRQLVRPDDDVRGERPSALSLAMIAMAHGHGHRVTFDHIRDIAAEASSGSCHGRDASSAWSSGSSSGARSIKHQGGLTSTIDA